MNKTTKTIKREAAEARQAKYDNLSTEDKLERLAGRPGQALKETARLLRK